MPDQTEPDNLSVSEPTHLTEMQEENKGPMRYFFCKMIQKQDFYAVGKLEKKKKISFLISSGGTN